MHIRKGAWRNFIGVAAVLTLALPTAAASITASATPAAAQVPPSSISVAGTAAPCSATSAAASEAAAGCIVSATPAIAVNPIGTPHTVTFSCGPAAATLAGTTSFAPGFATPLFPAGCYDVSATVTDITTGTASAFTTANCGANSTTLTGANVNCAAYASPLCPAGLTSFGTGTAGTCVVPGAGVATPAPAARELSVTINPGAPHAYLVTFTGYTAAGGTAAAPVCPAGTTMVGSPAAVIGPGGAPPTNGFTLTVSTGTPPGEAALPVNVACQFTLSVQKKYVEINTLRLVGTTTPGGTTLCSGASPLVYAEGLKSFFGAPCYVSAYAAGTVVLKTGVDCTTEPPATGAALPAGEFAAAPAISGIPAPAYSCVNGTLSVSNVFIPALPVTYTVSGPAGGTTGPITGPTLGGNCTSSAAGTVTGPTAVTGGFVAFCPSGVGSATVSATLGGAGINTQPAIASANTVTFGYVLPGGSRVVPYVRWAGEKQVLTKCFGGAGLFGGTLAEFTLQGAGSGSLQASLIPASFPTGAGPVAGGGGAVFPTDQSTVFTTTDASGCATVILYAAGEGVANVDVSLFSATPAGVGAGATVPLVNEHAFEVFYLKFDHLNLEDLGPSTGANSGFVSYSSATLASSLGFSTTPVGFSTGAIPGTFRLPPPPGTVSPGANGVYTLGICDVDYVRAMVHGYFEMPGDPSGRSASSVGFTPGAPAGAATGYVLPAGRWVLPEDWPVLATFAGFNAAGGTFNPTPSSVYAWDLNSGWVFNPGGERAVLCQGPITNPASNPPAAVSDGPLTGYAAALGPCYSQDAAGTTYNTAPGAGCAGGLTIGIGPFDATQACTNPFPLTYAPSGSSVLSVSGAGAFSVGALSANSTYLPNGTLNQWDAPMPPAQVSFGLVGGGPGTLRQVNKTGVYNVGSQSTTGGALYPDPFYAEAIPASPLIPPVANNGGYLWDSYGFTGGGTVLGPTATGAFVPGQSTQSPTNAATAGCAGTVAGYTPGCGGVPTNGPGGLDISGPYAATCGGVTSPVGTANVVTVANAAGFAPGMTAEIYSTTTGGTFATGLHIIAVGAVPAGAPGGAVGTASGCIAFAEDLAGFFLGRLNNVVIGEQLGVPSLGSAPVAGQSITLIQGGKSITSTVAGPSAYCTATVNPACPSAATALTGAAPAGTLYTAAGTPLVYVTGNEAIANALAACTTSRGVGPFAPAFGPGAGAPPVFGACEPGAPLGAANTAGFGYAGPGTIVNLGTAATAGILAGSAAIRNPYPFWQFVPNAGNGANTTATVYSDNHGEAMVSLSTGVRSQVAPVGGVCPANYTLVGTAAAGNLNCILNFASLGAGAGAFTNITAATAAYNAASTGCLQTNATGGTSPAAAATAPAAGATGASPVIPAGQICINNLGGIEFGTGATLGTTSIQAVADYPYFRGLHAPISSGTVTKVFTSSFAKSVSVTAGTPGPAGTTTYAVTISATDLCGAPITGEAVNVYALGNSGAIVLAPLGANDTPLSTSSARVVLGANGTATLSLEVLGSALGNQGLVIKAVFPAEAIERFYTVVGGTITGQTATALYANGYNMVGGPAASNFGQAEGLFAYNATTNNYTDVSASRTSIGSAPPSCQGYFAYFASTAAVNLNVTSKTGDTAVCTLSAGYNLVGNPFGSAANLPAGVTAYHYNPTTGAYDQVSQIPLGGAVFVYNDGTLNSLTLTAS